MNLQYVSLLIVLIVLFPQEQYAQFGGNNSRGGHTNVNVPFSIQPRYGLDKNRNGVVDMPNSKEYVLSPLRVTLTAIDLANNYPSSWPVFNKKEADYFNLKGPWRWTFRPKSASSVVQKINTLPMPNSPQAIPIRGSISVEELESVQAELGTDYFNLDATIDAEKIVLYSLSPRIYVDLFEGEWTVELARVYPNKQPIYWKTFDLKLEDILIVQLGDSYSSGEGAPDRKSIDKFWGDIGEGYFNSQASLNHRIFHRSSYTWGSIVAQKAEKFSTRTSVTYINLAESGATVDWVFNQLKKMADIIGPRKVDKVVMSIGGNDAGLANAIASYIVREPILRNTIVIGPERKDIERAIKTGNWSDSKFKNAGSIVLKIANILREDNWKRLEGLDGLSYAYDRLSDEFNRYGIPNSNIYIITYPDPFLIAPGNDSDVCPGPVLTNLGRDVTRFTSRTLEVGRKEQKHSRNNLIKPLNLRVTSFGRREGWNVIDCEKVFVGHAICQSGRMVLLKDESKSLQGDIRGVVHPNKKGYKAIADKAFKEIFPEY